MRDLVALFANNYGKFLYGGYSSDDGFAIGRFAPPLRALKIAQHSLKELQSVNATDWQIARYESECSRMLKECYW